MIDLAPAHKIGLQLAAPVMPAAGFWGFGPNQYAPLLDTATLGAIVTNPITLRPRRAYPSPAVTEATGGLILPAEMPNPGVRKVIRQNQKAWGRAERPVIAHLAADTPDDLARTAAALDGLGLLAGFELGLPPDVTPAETAQLVQMLVFSADLPVLVKLPFPGTPQLADAALNAGAVVLVLADAPRTGAGRFFGGGVCAQLLPHLQSMAETFPDAPIVACGGIHTPAEARACLHAGASALQLDSIFFANPTHVQRIANALKEKTDDQQP